MPLTHPAFTSPRYAEAILASKPLRYYRCNETGGTVLRDLCGTNNMTVTGTPTRMGTSGPPGIADGAGFKTTKGGGAYASGDTAALPSTAYTLAAWFIGGGSDASIHGIFGRWRGTNNGAILHRMVTTNNIRFVHRDVAIESSIADTNLWHFIVATWDGADIRLYVDGVFITSEANAVAPGGLGNWTINTQHAGASITAQIATGTTAECVLWSRALPIGEIAHYNALGR